MARRLVGLFGPDTDPDEIAAAVLAVVADEDERRAREGSTQMSTEMDHDLIAEAAAFAIVEHGDQERKETTIPYWTHLAAVAGLVQQHGGTAEQVAAGWLHDVVEDCGGEPMLELVQERFPAAVAGMVEQLSDSLVEDRDDKGPWRERKEAYLQRLRAHPGAASVLVSLADKLHNAEATVADLDDPDVGTAVFSRFTASAADTAWQYEQLLDVFRADGTLPEPMLTRLDVAVRRIREAADVVAAPSNPEDRT